MKHADKKRSNRNFELGDWVYIKLQPYHQMTVVNRKCLKLSARFFGPYQIMAKVGMVAYKLDLLASSQTILSFTCPQLKQHIGPPSQQLPLPLIDDTGVLMKEHISILDRRIGKKGGRVVTEVFVH